MLMGFRTYHWQTSDLAGTEMEPALRVLSSPTSSREEKREALGVLASSENVVAQGIAFDYYFYHQTLLRFGSTEHPFQDLADLLLTRAREQLRRAPVDSVGASGNVIRGANHASALALLARLGNEEDLRLIEPVLASSSDVDVLVTGLGAVQHCAAQTQHEQPALAQVLIRIVRGPAHTMFVRGEAVRALSTCPGDDVERALIEICEHEPFPMSAWAALALGDINLERYFALIQRAVESWPSDAPYPASDVREMLAGSDDDE